MRTLRIIELSDLHLLSKGASTERQLKEIDELFKAIPELPTVDILILAGDVFDAGVAMSKKYLPEVQNWIQRTLLMCARHNIRLRVLEGTPSHDRGQSREFVTQNNHLRSQADLLYASTLMIEYIKGLDTAILYIPDEYKSTTAEIKMAVEELMVMKGLTKVDFVVMHGFMEYQLPEGIAVKSQVHEQSYYESICSRYIFMGHDHNASSNSKVRVAGSTTRSSHGEEAPKGIWDIKSTGVYAKDKSVFRENHLAPLFLTIDAVDMTESILRAKLDDLVKLEEGSSFRIKVDDLNIHEALIKSYIKRHSWFKWKVTKTKSSLKSSDNHLTPKVFKGKPLNKHTIPDMLRNRLMASGVEPATVDQAIRQVELHMEE